MKKFAGDIIILYICTINNNLLMYAPEIWSVTDKIFCHSGLSFAHLYSYGPRKSEFWKIIIILIKKIPENFIILQK